MRQATAQPREKSLDEVAIESVERLASKADKTIDGNLKSALSMLERRLIELGKEARNERVGLLVPAADYITTGSQADRKTRLATDLIISDEITDLTDQYKKGIGRTVMGMFQSAQAQTWGIPMFKGMVDAMESEADKYSQKLARRLGAYKSRFASAKGYSDVLAAATQLRIDLKDAPQNIAYHLERVARADKAARDKLRQQPD